MPNTNFFSRSTQIFLFSVLFLILAYQEVQLADIENFLNSSAGATVAGTNAPVGTGTPAQNQPFNILNVLVNQRSPVGVVTKAFSNGSFQMEVRDFVDISKVDSSKPFADQSLLPKIKKVVTVNINSKTVFTQGTAAGVTVGHTVIVQSAESVYTTDTITALQVYDSAAAQ